MVSKVSPLAWNAPIVDDKGNPTPYFVRQLEQLLAEKAVTDALASAAVPQSRLISAGTGLTGGGDLTADRTITLDTTAEAERIRDVIGAALVAGTNITITVNDPGDTITITSAGGSGGLTLISSQSPSGTNVVTFSSIPNTYKDLVIMCQGRGTNASNSVSVEIKFNGDTTAANYSRVRIGTTDGAGTIAGTNSNDGLIGQIAAASATAGEAGSFEATIPNYSTTSFRKQWISRWDGLLGTTNSNLNCELVSGRWANTAAVSSFTLTTTAGGNWAAGSVVSLYGRA